MPKVAIHAVLAAHLKAARGALGISQAELGIEMGLPEDVASTRINRYERAVHAPDIETAERMAQALGLPLPALLSRDDNLAEAIAGFDLLSKDQQALILGKIRKALGAQQAKLVRGKLFEGGT
jgi:transcriptional regulator with XRE-family HTH domain